jgi:hypothetical protein
MPFRFAIRRCSLLETNHLFLRTSLRTRLLVTSLRKRLSRLSCDSPGLSITVTFLILSFLYEFYSIMYKLSFFNETGPEALAGWDRFFHKLSAWPFLLNMITYTGSVLT